MSFDTEPDNPKLRQAALRIDRAMLSLPDLLTEIGSGSHRDRLEVVLTRLFIAINTVATALYEGGSPDGGDARKLSIAAADVLWSIGESATSVDRNLQVNDDSRGAARASGSNF